MPVGASSFKDSDVDPRQQEDNEVDEEIRPSDLPF